jgi:hypothetical protein
MSSQQADLRDTVLRADALLPKGLVQVIVGAAIYFSSGRRIARRRNASAELDRSADS